MRRKFILAILVSLVAAWFLSGYMLPWVSRLQPVYLRMHVKSEISQTLLLFASPNKHFSNEPTLQIQIDTPEEWQSVQIPVPAYLAGHLRLGFATRYGTLQFVDMQLDKYPLDLVAAAQYEMRNVRSCDLQETGEISCRVAGEKAYITFPPRQLAPAVPWVKIWCWRVACFGLCFLLCFFLYKKYADQIFALLKKYCPIWLPVLLFILLVWTYYAMRFNAFDARMQVVFYSPKWPQFLLLAQEQAWAPALLLGAVWAVFVLKNKYLKALVIFLGSVLLLLEGIDCALLYLLNARFSPEQINVFGRDILFTVKPFLKSYLNSRAGVYTLACVGSWGILCLYAWRHTLTTNLRKIVCIFAVLGFAWYLIPSATTPAEKIQLRDWPRLSLRTLWQTGDDTTPQATDFRLTYQCQDGLNSRQNVVIVLIESLSSYMSNYFANGKAEKWTPHLDRLAQKYVPFTNYRTNSNDTTQALFSIVTGVPSIHYFAESNLYREPKFYHNTLSKTFHQAGYHTAFLTSASMVYSKDYILNNAVFDEISKDNDPFYDGQKRFVFHSVADDVLYARAEKWIENYKQKKPYLLLIETTTSHNPFVDPVSGEESLEKSIRYADKAVGDFIENLTKKNLLDNTLVVVTSDHRVMLPLTDRQSRIFGEHAEARIPFVLIGSPLKGKQTLQASHIDLAPSLEYLTLPKACFHPYQHNIFSGQDRDSCTLFQSFMDKHLILAQCQNQYAKICLATSNNQFCDGTLPEPTAGNLLSFINWIRDNNRY